MDAGGRVATIEAALHAVASIVTGCAWTAHTHPTAVTGLLSSDAGRLFAEHPLFPDQIVVTGTSALHVPYTDPGLPLARAFRAALEDYAARTGRWPRLVLLANHGMVALGRTANEVFEITRMTDKSARIFAVAAAAGTVIPLSAEAVERIDTRPDEEYRRRVLHPNDEGTS
jgi:rhamnose utilization protein RhaD (predicted bifunctional aldolase and dehydrogenase)